MLVYRLRKRISPILQHLHHQLKFFVELRDGIFLFLLKLLLDFLNILLKYLCFAYRRLDFLQQDSFLFDHGIHLWLLLLNYGVAYLMSFVIANNTFRTNVNLIIFTKVFGFLLGMLQAELVQSIFNWCHWHSLIVHYHV